MFTNFVCNLHLKYLGMKIKQEQKVVDFEICIAHDGGKM